MQSKLFAKIREPSAPQMVTATASLTDSTRPFRGRPGVRLPARERAPSPTTASPVGEADAPSADPPEKPIRILLVDDEQDVLRAESLWLNAAGYLTEQVLDGEQAMAAVRRDRPDAIVLDVRMPKKDGLQVMEELQEHAATQEIPVVMLSASLGDEQRALDAGATFFLRKPYVGATLVAAVYAAVHGQNSPIDRRSQP